MIIPFPVNQNYTENIPSARHDERDTMFSRKELIPGTDRYKEYYQKNPEKEILDTKFRQEPGLLSPESVFYHQTAFEAAETYFKKVKGLYPLVTGEVCPSKTDRGPAELASELKEKAIALGALDAGITPVKEYHFYAVKGRGPDYNRKIEIKHRYAIAFTVEMDHEMVKSAPKASIVLESARQYLNSARIAVELASLIRSYGYGARAHIDGNYEVVCPLVARDAGLGEIGRMGLLMTPKHGPRVRISVVTTDMKLKPDQYKKDNSVIDFFRMCKK
ncbi:MAG: hypothetical protein K8R53_03420 [Bacteroidales bacterium]|nr:hypothetical protein [Bacteroidales bacterium]